MFFGWSTGGASNCLGVGMSGGGISIASCASLDRGTGVNASAAGVFRDNRLDNL